MKICEKHIRLKNLLIPYNIDLFYNYSHFHKHYYILLNKLKIKDEKWS